MKDHIAIYEKIIADRMIYGKTLSEAAFENGVSYPYARSAFLMFSAVKDEDWDSLERMVRKYNMPFDRVEWAAGKLGKTLPPSIKKAYEEQRVRDRERQKAKYDAKKEQYPDMTDWVSQEKAEEPEPQPEPEPQQAPEPIPPEVIVEKKLDNTSLYLIKMLESQAKLIELMEQLMDVVIPKWAVHVTENANANGDAVQEMLKPIATGVDAIRCNTKKRGM